MEQEIDPVKYEIFRHRLFHILEEGRIAMKMVSGSPVVVEGGETCCSLCTADGTTILVAAGILVHAHSVEPFVRQAIEWYEEELGFEDGDQLFFNDPYVAGQHLPDMVIIKPIFHKGKHLAWVGSIMHTPEIGGMEPAGLPPTATEIYQEGLRAQGLKILEKGKIRKDIYNTILAQVRDPHLVALDTKAKIAANNTCARGYLQLIDRFGLEFVLAAGNKIIEEGERLARDKLRSLPDGTWRSRIYGDASMAEGGGLYKIVCTMTKEEDKLTFDLTGSSPQTRSSMNSTLPATWGQIFVALTSQLFWDVPWNGGMFAPVKVVAPEGTIVNCRFPCAVSHGVRSCGILIGEVAHECIAKMLHAGGMYEDVNAGWKGSACSGPRFGGINQFGAPCAGVTLDSFAGGLGASPFRDGVNTGAMMMNPQSSISDVEIIELNTPFLYLKRENATDSGGFGKFAGGMAPEMIWMVYGTHDLRVSMTREARKAPGNFGLFGGYPGALGEGLLVFNSTIAKWFEQSKTLISFEDVKHLDGEIVNPTYSLLTQRPADQYDLVLGRGGAGAGYGDPLERDPNKVLTDVRNHAVSIDTALRVYGVVIDPKTMQLDLRETEDKRRSIIEERLREGKRPRTPNVDDLVTPREEARALVRMHEYLEIADIGGHKVIRCVKCGNVFCDAQENYKNYALLRERSPAELKSWPTLSGEPAWTLYQEYICPGCGTLLQVDVISPQLLDPGEERILWDIQLKL